MSTQNQSHKAPQKKPRTEQAAQRCLHIGGVVYPPYQVLWDIAREGESVVRERLSRACDKSH